VESAGILPQTAVTLVKILLCSWVGILLQLAALQPCLLPPLVLLPTPWNASGSPEQLRFRGSNNMVAPAAVTAVQWYFEGEGSHCITDSSVSPN